MLAIVIILVCIGLNAVLACAEMAFVSIDKNFLHKEALGGNNRAAYVEEMRESPERILSVVQIGITLVGAISGAVGGAGAEEKIAPWLMDNFGISEKLAESISIASVVIPITFLSIVVGELVPKSVAIRYSYRLCMFFSPALRFTERYLGFLVNPMEKITNYLVGFFLPRSKSEPKTVAITEISLNGLKSEHKTYILNLIDLDARTAATAMVPWPRVETINSDSSPSEIYAYALSKGHTRYPVIDSGEVYGFLHLKDFLQLQHAGEEENWLSFVHPTTFIGPDTKLLTALKLMKSNRVQILIVGNPTRPMGILTLQDVIEEVVGDVVDSNEDKRIVGFLRHRVIKDKR